MTKEQETEMHDLAHKLYLLTGGAGGWEASRYGAIGATMEQLVEYCDIQSHADAIAVAKRAAFVAGWDAHRLDLRETTNPLLSAWEHYKNTHTLTR